VVIMDFLELQPGRKRSAALDHLIIGVVFALTLAVFHLSYDMHRGKGSVSDGAAFSVAFLGVADYFGWLPSLWSASRRGRVRSLVMPVFIVLVFSYLYLTFRTYYIQPWATVLCFSAQLGALVSLSART
jgi:hypothetical protein